tara:strand:+ start:2095 stop:2373 length:279 start_codon:yes stop_codon:yes gene_type:complete
MTTAKKTASAPARRAVSKSVETGDKRPEDDKVAIIAWVALRHYEWLVRRASILGCSTEALLDVLVRQGRAADPTKGGQAMGGTVQDLADFDG